MSYDKARADFEFLEALAELEDQVELDASRVDLMRNPSKAEAAKLYAAGIRLWFGEHGDEWGELPDVAAIREEYDV